MSESVADDYGFTMHDFFLIKNTIHNVSIIYIYYYYYLCEIFEKLSYSYKICYIDTRCVDFIIGNYPNEDVHFFDFP